MLAQNVRYRLAIIASGMALAIAVYSCLGSPFADAWGAWCLAAILGGLLGAMLHRGRKILRVAKWVCYATLLACGLLMIVGIYGVFIRSVDLAMSLIVGAGWAIMIAVNLAGVLEAEHRGSR